MPDVFNPEWMPLYWDRLLKDIRDLTTEQIGAYILLLGYQWEEGGIPAGVVALAAIAKVSVPKMRVAMAAFGHRFQSHSTLPNTLINPFMEIVREEQRVKFETSSRKGQMGAQQRWKDRRGNAPAISPGIPSATDTATAPGNADIENRDHHLASLGDDAGARTRDAAQRSPAYAFCEWMLETGIKRDVIAAHFGGDPFAWCYKHLAGAETLIDTYGDAEARVRAERLFAMKSARRLRREVSPRTLLDAWDWDEIKGTPAVAGGAKPAPHLSESQQKFIDSLRRRTEGV